MVRILAAVPAAASAHSAPSAHELSQLFLQMNLHNLTPRILPRAPDTAGMDKIVLRTNDGNNGNALWLDRSSNRFYYESKSGGWWAGPLNIRMDAREQSYARSYIQRRLSEVNLSDTIISGPPPSVRTLVPLSVSTPGSPARQTAYIDAQNGRLYMHVKHPGDDGRTVQYWSGPIPFNPPSID